MDNTNQSLKHRNLGIFVLILTTILWGSTFIITKIMTKEVPLNFFLGMRFLFALLIFFPFIGRLKDINKKMVWFGFLTGFIYYLAITTQTIGLQTTTAGKGGFITGLNSVLVPFMAWALYKKPLDRKIWVALILSVLGMGILFLEGESGMIDIGDIFVLICAFLFALYIILVDKGVELGDIYQYLIIQLVVVSGFCFLSSLIFQESYDINKAPVSFWYILIYMGCVAAGLTFLSQNWGQKQVGPTQTAIIFTLEPVFALLFASFIISNEPLSFQMILGCSLIFIAIFLTVINNDVQSEPI